MKKSFIALGLTAILAVGSVSTVFSQPSVTTEQNCGGEKCKKKKKKKKECSKGEKESSAEEKTEGATK